MDISLEAKSRLSRYAELLLKWQSSINLISNSTKDFLWERHIEDSFELLPFVSGDVSSHVDIGSGGGLPAVPLAIVLGGPIVCVDSDLKKCIFLREVSRETNANLDVRHMRVDDYIAGHRHGADIVTARALAPLCELLDWSSQLLSPVGVAAFLKGQASDEEIEKARKSWTFDLEKRKTKGEGYALRIQNIGGRDG